MWKKSLGEYILQGGIEISSFSLSREILLERYPTLMLGKPRRELPSANYRRT